MPKVAMSKFHMPKFQLTKFHMPKVLYAEIPIAKIHWSRRLSNFCKIKFKWKLFLSQTFLADFINFDLAPYGRNIWGWGRRYFYFNPGPMTND